MATLKSEIVKLLSEWVLLETATINDEESRPRADVDASGDAIREARERRGKLRTITIREEVEDL